MNNESSPQASDAPPVNDQAAVNKSAGQAAGNVSSGTPNGDAANPLTKMLKEMLEVSGKLIIGLAGLCYVIGLVVVTIHLRQYGLNSLNLPQLHYVTAGVWTLLPIILIVLLIFFSIYMFFVQQEELRQKKGIDKIWTILILIVTVVVLSYFSLGFLGRNAGVKFGWTDWVFIPMLGMFAVLCLTLSGMFLFQTQTYAKKEIFLFSGVLVVGIICSMFYVVLFATHTYETIPWSTGGGRPSRVQLIVAPDSKDYFESVGITFSAGQNRTESLTLLLVTDKEYVLTKSDNIAISIPYDSVKSVVYER